MITPDFDISQDLDKIILKIKIKYIKSSDIQIDIFQNEFKLYANPYFLRLYFPGNLIQDGREIVEYDVGLGELNLQIPKETPQEFKDLEFRTKLLSKISKENDIPLNPLIQELDTNKNEAGQGEEEIDWDAPQIIKSSTSLLKKYGFNSAYSGLGSQLECVSGEMLLIYDLDSLNSDFKEMLKKTQEEKFDQEYYLMDLNEGIPIEIQEFKSEFSRLLYKIQNGLEDSENCLDSTDQSDLAKLYWKEYLLDNPAQIYLGLVDLMFSFSYNYFITLGENNSESAWNLVKISPTLNSFVTFDSLEQTILSCFKQSLCWPLLRNWEFSLKVLHHTTILFKLGKKTLLKCLLVIKRILESDDRTFTICQIWINDYLVWIQSCSEKTLASLASRLHHFQIKKQDFPWDL